MEIVKYRIFRNTENLENFLITQLVVPETIQYNFLETTFVY